MNRSFLLLLLSGVFCFSNAGLLDNNIRRLPGDLKPISYSLILQPYFNAPGVTIDPEKDQTFDGFISINFTVIKPTSKIVLNAKNLVLPVYKDIIVLSEYQTIKTIDLLISPENQTISIELERELQHNEIVLVQFTYSGVIGDDTEYGFFKSTDPKNAPGEVVYVTHFETTGARLLFPCFDEPDYKATFEIMVYKPKSLVALSNTMNVSTIDMGNGYEAVFFEKTEIMSTYLLAIGIGDLVGVQGFTSDGILTRIWSYRSGKGQLEAALKSAIRCTDAMTKYTNYQLPLKKIDHLAVPLFLGAMENFGLIVYSGHFLLLDPIDTQNQLLSWMGMTSVICHELSHHWFGDVVTNKWWGDIFLHEGFADFFENKAIALAYPKEKDLMDARFAKMNSFIIQDNNDKHDHPIITKNGSFDGITYLMGGGVIRQLEAVISPEILQKGLQSYIHKYQFSNANYQQLLDEIQNAVDETELKDWCGEAFNVTNFMNLWLNQEGHPSLNVDYLNGTFLITQNVQNGTNEKLWPLPVFVQLNNNQKRIYWSAPNYVCKNNRILPKTLKIKTDILFVNRDILSVASTYYSTKAIQVIVDALTTFTTNLQLSPASLHAFITDVFSSAVKNGTPKAHLKNMFENVLMSQRNAFSFGVFQEFMDKIEAWLEEGHFDNVIEKLHPSK